MRQILAFHKVSVVSFTLMLHPAEVGTHFVRQTGEPIAILLNIPLPKEKAEEKAEQ